MTKLGEYLVLKSVNKSEVSRKTGLSKSRLSQLVNNAATKLRADELFVIAIAIDVKPGDMMDFIFEDLKKVKTLAIKS